MTTLQNKIDHCEFAPYIYAYPLTQMYQPLHSFSLELPQFTRELNIYIHIPFCEQKCTFCGYVTVITTDQDVQETYVDCIVKEIGMHREVLAQSTITSINFGGGTPSLLTTSQFQKIMNALRAVNPSFSDAIEISIEATPESIQNGKITALRQLGINRVSIGIQTFNNAEISQSKRHNLADTSVQAVQTLQQIGIPNICCDLMYGLPGQTLDSWQHSVQSLLALRPNTIELYSTVLIPGTPLARSTPQQMSNQQRLDCYAYAQQTFLQAGYAQDCHLRFVLPGSGAYKQQEHVWAGQSLLGFGVGARSYATNIHYRNTYGSRHQTAFTEYITTITNGQLATSSGIVLSPRDQLKRYVIYNLEHLGKDEFETTFPHLYGEMLSLGLAENTGTTMRLTAKGLSFRDVLAHQICDA